MRSEDDRQPWSVATTAGTSVKLDEGCLGSISMPSMYDQNLQHGGDLAGSLSRLTSDNRPGAARRRPPALAGGDALEPSSSLTKVARRSSHALEHDPHLSHGCREGSSGCELVSRVRLEKKPRRRPTSGAVGSNERHEHLLHVPESQCQFVVRFTSTSPASRHTRPQLPEPPRAAPSTSPPSRPLPGTSSTRRGEEPRGRSRQRG